MYVLTRLFPKDELYILTSQIKRAGISVLVNIAEGVGRNYRKDSIQFLHISRGSPYELETLVTIAVTTGIMREVKYNELLPTIDPCLEILNGLINYFEKAILK